MNNVKNKRKNNVFFSIILTTYNSEIYIRSALKNLINQKFKEFEVILVDDGSSDNTLHIAKLFKNKLNLKIFKLFHFGSPARSRNFGIKKSKGKYLCFFDCDDSFYNDKLWIIYNFIKKNNSDVFYHNVYLKKEKKNFYSKYINQKNSFKDLLLNGNKIIFSSSCLKKKFLIKKNIKFNENKKFVSVEDYDFWLKVAKSKGYFFLINRILGAYNLNVMSISRNRINHYLNTLSLLNSYKKFLVPDIINFKLRKIYILISFIKISIYEKNFEFLFFIFSYLIGFRKK